ncbi:hypothetical protein GCM10027318_02970 [Massilia agilis]
MPHKVSPLTTTCWSGASGRKSLPGAACAPAIAAHVNRAAAARRVPTMLKFFIETVRKVRLSRDKCWLRRSPRPNHSTRDGA